MSSELEAAKAECSVAEQLHWLDPNHRAMPADAVQRIRHICTLHNDLFMVMWTVMATHASLPRDILAVALQQCRTDMKALSREDIVSLMTALVNGGRQGFEAVLRTRRSMPRNTAALPWGAP